MIRTLAIAIGLVVAGLSACDSRPAPATARPVATNLDEASDAARVDRGPAGFAWTPAERNFALAVDDVDPLEVINVASEWGMAYRACHTGDSKACETVIIDRALMRRWGLCNGQKAMWAVSDCVATLGTPP